MESLRQRAAYGVKWTTISTSAVFLIEFLRIAILAHILKAEDFGLATMVLVVLGFAQTFADVGITNAVIQRENPTKEELSSLYWLNIFAGIFIAAVMISVTGLIVKFYHEPRLYWLIPLASINFVISPIGSLFATLLQKELRFKELGMIEPVSVFAGFLVAVFCALGGYGVYSIILGAMASSLIGALLVMAVGLSIFKPLFRFKVSDLAGYVSFGLYQLGERSINYFSSNVDYLFVGKFLGPSVLGVYMLAYQLVVKPIFRINPILSKVAFPIFSKRQNDNPSLVRGYKELIKLLSFVIFPILVGLGVTANRLIPAVYGKNWDLAVPLVKILILLGILKTLSNPMSNILLAKGRADIGFKLNVLIASINTIVFYLAAQGGVFYVAWGWIALCLVYFYVGWYILYRLINFTFSDFVLSFLKPALISIFMAFMVHMTDRFASKLSFNELASLLTMIAAGAIFYLGALWVFEGRYIRDLFGLFLKSGGEA